MGPGRTVLGVTVAFVRHPVEEGAGPDGDTAERGGDGRVVDEKLVVHHLELGVSPDPEVGSPHADDRSVSDVGKSLYDKPVAGHFPEPVVVATLRPVLGVVSVGDGEDADLVAL